jgi:sulfite reductase (NADPH) flavoprotein alpha-component
LIHADVSHHVLAALALLGYVLLCTRVWCQRRREQQRDAAARAALQPAAAGLPVVLVAYASQTGNAEQLAWQTANALHTAGTPTLLLPLSEVTVSTLQSVQRALFLISTYGEGDAPDSATLFARQLLPATVALDSLHYAVLALGDRKYQHYCGFGQSVDGWLTANGAQPMFKRIDVNNSDAESLAAWRHQLSHLAGTSDLPDWQAPRFEPWRLGARKHLNPGSAGAPTYQIVLTPPPEADASWQAGDLIQVLLADEPDRPREYSIASVLADGAVHLLVRLERHANGTCGKSSVALTQTAQPGDVIAARLRAHSNFREGDNAGRDLILIGNGTGLAGLRAHLRARALRIGAHSPPLRHWLIFGERNSAVDRYYADELEQWHHTGHLTRLDLVYSRDGSAIRYVQDQLRVASNELLEWVNAGAAIYVCGSLEGMASGVEQALSDILGSDQVAALMASGRYRRDVY